mmetsp:Transcript_2131/g.2715  ORF Transcript_2131/g.2715 Transcript_2131/m.2715 type:complete len:176 (+) Transcript_2131:1007-1534(+)
MTVARIVNWVAWRRNRSHRADRRNTRRDNPGASAGFLAKTSKTLSVPLNWVDEFAALVAVRGSGFSRGWDLVTIDAVLLPLGEEEGVKVGKGVGGDDDSNLCPSATSSIVSLLMISVQNPQGSRAVSPSDKRSWQHCCIASRDWYGEGTRDNIVTHKVVKRNREVKKRYWHALSL